MRNKQTAHFCIDTILHRLYQTQYKRRQRRKRNRLGVQGCKPVPRQRGLFMEVSGDAR